jgi:hypothetical protein
VVDGTVIAQTASGFLIAVDKESFARMLDPIPDESRLFVYFSMCLLRELQVPLQLAGVRSRLQLTGDTGDEPPQLMVEHPAFGWMNEMICALPFPVAGQNSEWWFEWRLFALPCRCSHCTQRKPQRICLAVDMQNAARLVVQQLREEP